MGARVRASMVRAREGAGVALPGAWKGKRCALSGTMVRDLREERAGAGAVVVVGSGVAGRCGPLVGSVPMRTGTMTRGVFTLPGRGVGPTGAGGRPDSRSDPEVSFPIEALLL